MGRVRVHRRRSGNRRRSAPLNSASSGISGEGRVGVALDADYGHGIHRIHGPPPPSPGFGFPAPPPCGSSTPTKNSEKDWGRGATILVWGGVSVDSVVSVAHLGWRGMALRRPRPLLSLQSLTPQFPEEPFYCHRAITAENAVERRGCFWQVIHPNLLCALGGLCGDILSGACR